jgi:hypothetical protein
MPFVLDANFSGLLRAHDVPKIISAAKILSRRKRCSRGSHLVIVSPGLIAVANYGFRRRAEKASTREMICSRS